MFHLSNDCHDYFNDLHTVLVFRFYRNFCIACVLIVLHKYVKNHELVNSTLISCVPFLLIFLGYKSSIFNSLVLLYVICNLLSLRLLLLIELYLF